MYRKIENGEIVDIQGLKCCIPPVGYVWNIFTDSLELTGVYSRSNDPKEQYWERFPYPSWYKEVTKREDEYLKSKKEDSSPFYDKKYEDYKKQEWFRRLNGMWIMIKGKPVFLPPLYYYILQWFRIDVGYVKFTKPHLKAIMFLSYCIDDPICWGMLGITKRRFLKTYMIGAFIVEYVTRTKNAIGGLQSKTGNDAKKVFAKAVVYPFRGMPRFFRPEYDTSLGVNPKTEMRFQQTNIRGKKAEDKIDKDELNSGIEWGSADPIHFDGSKLARYGSDEWGKCFIKGTKIRMYDGCVKNVEEINNEELVMGNDSTPRLVKGKTFGVEKMYKIVPNKGEGFSCNESHILYLSISDKIVLNGVKYSSGDYITISVKEYFDIKPCYRKCVAIIRTGWEYKENNHLIDPYMMGVWLGDGNSRDFSVTSIDEEIISSINTFADEQGLFVRRKDDNISYHVTSRKAGVNHVTKELRRLNLLQNKHIPREYLIDSKENRLKLLAGIADTDGYSILRGDKCCGVQITQKIKDLSYDIQELATSLGFYCSLNEKIARMKRGDGSIYTCVVYKLSIYGDIDLIPHRIERKKCFVSRTKNRRNPLKTGFIIEELGEGEYFGFSVDRNHLFLLKDGTVVHNTTEANVFDRNEVVRFCQVDEEGKIIGKSLWFTTVEKLDSDKDGVQQAARDLWNASNQNSRKGNGQTESGLYRFFQTADESKNFDIYGDPDVEKTINEILADRDAVKDNARSLFARMRKEPRTIDEAFSIDADSCIFNTFNIEKRKKQLEENPIHKRSIWFFRDEDTQKVKWRDILPKEKEFCWKVSPRFDLSYENANKFDKVGDLKRPARTKIGAIAIDGYSNSQGGEKWGSKASAWIGLRSDGGHRKLATAHLYGRPNEKSTLYEQVMLAAEFTGFEAFFEHNSDAYYDYFKVHGKLLYLGIYPKILIDPIKLEETTRHRGTPTTPYSLTTQTDLGVSYFENDCYEIDFEILFPDAEIFDPNNRTKSDITVSFLILIAVLSEEVYIPPVPKTPQIATYGGSPSIRHGNPALADY